MNEWMNEWSVPLREKASYKIEVFQEILMATELTLDSSIIQYSNY